jgi:hypothetical protein
MAETAVKPKLCWLLQQVGVLMGFIIMFLIALFEGDMEGIGGGGHGHSHG